MGMTLSRREFLETLTVGGAAAVAGMRAPHLLAQGSKQPLQPWDFNYLGCFKVPQWAFQPDPTWQNDRTSFNYSDSWESPLVRRYEGGRSSGRIRLPFL